MDYERSDMVDSLYYERYTMNVRVMFLVLMVGVVGGASGMEEELIQMIEKHGPTVGMDESKIACYVWQLKHDLCSFEFYQDELVKAASRLYNKETRENQLAIVLINPRIHRNIQKLDVRFKGFGYEDFSTDEKGTFANVIKLYDITKKDTAYRPLDGWFNKFTFEGKEIKNELKDYVVVGRLDDLDEELLWKLRETGDTELKGIFKERKKR